jgi:hypothetical protein
MFIIIAVKKPAEKTTSFINPSKEKIMDKILNTNKMPHNSRYTLAT